ncbi:MAG: ABC transporter ATP-binding protein [Dermabacter sp.]|nr:ABC transporter ATP-binding protein [Dermabacter sp.]
MSITTERYAVQESDAQERARQSDPVQEGAAKDQAARERTVPEGAGADGADAVLDVQDLRVTYRRGNRRTDAVRGVTLRVGRGEAVALVGESGSGKSSIARAILGLLAQSADTSGSVSVLGTDLRSAPARQARRLRGREIGYVPQDPGASLDPIRRIIDQVMEPLVIHGIGDPREHRAKALQALRDAGLANAEEIGRRWPHQLSGGQRQRALIAAAIVTDPQLIVADEPTSALDVTVQKVILDKLQEITRERGTAILLITHDLAVAAGRTDRVYAMSDGLIVEDGPSRRVLLDPEHEYTKELVAAIPGRRHARSDAPAAAAAPSASDTPGSADQCGPAGPLDPSDPSAPAILEGRGLVQVFGARGSQVTALDDVSVQLARGASLGVVGESGSGKTTLARVLLGLQRPDAGEVLSNGASIARPSAAVRRRIQPVFQNPHTSFDPMRSVGWSILEPLRGLAPRGLFGPRLSRAARKAKLIELMESVGLDPALAARKPWELSGGQLQRAAIARALSVDPEVLVCDEAVSALDVTVQAKVLDLLTRLQRERGLTLLFITHDLSVVQDLCAEVVVMKDGAVVERGATASVFAAPQHAYTKALIEAIPDPWGSFAA